MALILLTKTYATPVGLINKLKTDDLAELRFYLRIKPGQGINVNS